MRYAQGRRRGSGSFLHPPGFALAVLPARPRPFFFAHQRAESIIRPASPERTAAHRAADLGCSGLHGGAAKRVEAALNFQVLRSGVAHGLVLWFDARLLGDIGFSSGPGGSATIYGHVFLPWLQPVALGEGEHVLVALDASHVAGDYVWRWETQIAPAHGRPAIHFRQSTLEGAIFSPPSLRRRSADYVPQLTREGQAHLWLLSAMNGKLSLAEIAREAAARFPTLFPEWQQAFECAIELAAKF